MRMISPLSETPQPGIEKVWIPCCSVSIQSYTTRSLISSHNITCCNTLNSGNSRNVKNSLRRAPSPTECGMCSRSMWHVRRKTMVTKAWWHLDDYHGSARRLGNCSLQGRPIAGTWLASIQDGGIRIRRERRRISVIDTMCEGQRRMKIVQEGTYDVDDNCWEDGCCYCRSVFWVLGWTHHRVVVGFEESPNDW